MFRGPCKAVEAPYDNRIKLPFAGSGHQLVKLWP